MKPVNHSASQLWFCANGAFHTSPGRKPRVTANELLKPCRGETIRAWCRFFGAGLSFLPKPGAVALGWYGSPRRGFRCPA